jgi:hypothetical protein
MITIWVNLLPFLPPRLPLAATPPREGNFFGLSILTLLLLAACNPYKNTEFESCADYAMRPYPHPRVEIPMHFPVGWEIETDVVEGDWLSVTAIDTAILRENDVLQSVGYIQFPAPGGYRRSVQQVLAALRNQYSFLVLQRGLIRIDGIALDYIIGNDEFSSTLIIPYEMDGQMLTVIGRIDRQNAPSLNNFCFLGPVLEKLVQSHPDVQV